MAAPSPRSEARCRAPAMAGYTYLAVLMMLAVFSIISAGTLRIGLLAQRHAAEQDLLERGYALTLALESYAATTPQGSSPVPPDVEALLRDPRFPRTIVRHLRRMPADPITGSSEWGILRTDDGRGIAGFHSLSPLKPFRRDLRAPFSEFEDLPRYRDWVFRAGLGE